MGFGLGTAFAGLGGIASGIGSYLSAGAQQKGAEQRTAYMQAERERAQKRGEELYGEYLPAAGFGMDALQQQYDLLIKGDMSKFQQSPGYQFAMEQGTQALERGAAAQGGLFGGRQAKELTRFGQGLASQDFGNYLQQLSGLSQQGISTGLQGAGGIMGQYGGVSGAQIGQGLMAIGSAKGLGTQAAWETGADLMNLGAASTGYRGGVK